MTIQRKTVYKSIMILMACFFVVPAIADSDIRTLFDKIDRIEDRLTRMEKNINKHQNWLEQDGKTIKNYGKWIKQDRKLVEDLGRDIDKLRRQGVGQRAQISRPDWHNRTRTRPGRGSSLSGGRADSSPVTEADIQDLWISIEQIQSTLNKLIEGQ